MFPSALRNLTVTNFTDDLHSFPWESTPLVKHFQMDLWESYQEVERLFQTLEQIIVSVDSELIRCLNTYFSASCNRKSNNIYEKTHVSDFFTVFSPSGY